MKATITSVAVELCPCESRGGLAESLVGPIQLAILALELLEPLKLAGRQSSPAASVALCLPHPLAQRLRRAAHLLGDRADRRPLRGCGGCCSRTSGTARSRSSAGYLLRLPMAPSSQRLEPPRNPGRFTLQSFTTWFANRASFSSSRWNADARIIALKVEKGVAEAANNLADVRAGSDSAKLPARGLALPPPPQPGRRERARPGHSWGWSSESCSAPWASRRASPARRLGRHRSPRRDPTSAPSRRTTGPLPATHSRRPR